MEKKYYYGNDWLRTLACAGIVMMHIAANNTYQIPGLIYGKIIPSFTDCVFVFMMISAFSMCCGYYEKVQSGKINWGEFYKRRYSKVIPFFAILVIIDLVIHPSIDSFFEGFVDLTLTHGFIPNEIYVIGVGWFLGLVFVFYFVFPFFCTLISTKKRACYSFMVSLLLSYICKYYFNLDRTNILYSSPFFVMGGLIYLFRERIEKIAWYIFFPQTIFSILVYYIMGSNLFTCIFVSASLLIQVVPLKSCNKFVVFISSISMEIYLSHMVVFRGIEKLHLNTIWGDGWLQYFLTVSLVFMGTICFSVILKQMLRIVKERFCNDEQEV